MRAIETAPARQFKRRRFGAHGAAVTLLLLLHLPARTELHAQTLSLVLSQNGVTLESVDRARADRSINSYATGSDSGHFGIAYYVNTGSDTLADSLHVSVLNRATHAWTHRAVARTKARTAADSLAYNAGSAIRVTFARNHVFVDTHVNPSRGTLFVFNPKLELVAVLNGWSELLLPGGAVIYERSTVHFASTHPAELWLFNPASKRHAAIYPTQPYDVVRTEYVKRVRDIYARLGEDWFRLNNHHMMAEQFESRIGTPLADSGGTRIAFIAMFGDGGGSRASTPVVEVLVVCSAVLSAPTCAETELSEMRRRRPGLSEEQILREALSRGG